ncbi:sugar fermentation stimulation protein A [Methanohalophilus levihalophilus]|uniref:DNA/RNA nuclease SfsA n=1 Tax=Methanohalophilus levihalophilus TaxID=1431282 RepID=UPI001AE6A7DB|nr:DNA/RNA nuclease SfsA [Methanohalophilus levihalophilus]MBP2031199.1 sugar fermentation stimulation protein A [Methanohalophilus levihalophilus]
MAKSLRSMDVLEIGWDVEAVLLERPNRFLAIVDIPVAGLEEVPVHVHDPGRLEDILYPGNHLLLKKASNPNRKTGWDVIAGRIGENWVLINSAYHRKIAEWIFSKPNISPLGEIDSLAAEQNLGKSRIDFLAEKNGEKWWIEVKGCTLAENENALFPDAPTLRGKRHLEELGEAVNNGDRAAIFILIFREEAKCFSPNEKIDPAFYNTFYDVLDKGVEVYPFVFGFEKGTIRYKMTIKTCKR